MERKLPIPKVFFAEKRYGFEMISLSTLHKRLVSKDHDPHKPHRLKFYAILFINGGEGKHFIDFENYSFVEGTVLFLSNGQVHAFDKTKDYKGELILFTEDFLFKNLSEIERTTFSWLYNYPIYSPKLILKQDQFLQFKNVVKSLKDEYNSKDDQFKIILLRNILKQLLILSERYRHIDGVKIDSPYSNEFVRLQKLLLNNINQKKNVSFYANELGLSPKKMNIVTNSMVNMSSKNYITSILLLEIKRVLISTLNTIDNIAYSFGFDEPTNFVKFFKKHTGKTPLDFRKLINS